MHYIDLFLLATSVFHAPIQVFFIDNYPPPSLLEIIFFPLKEIGCMCKSIKIALL